MIVIAWRGPASPRPVILGDRPLEVFDAAEQETLRELLRRLTARVPPDGDPAADGDPADGA